MHSLFAPGRGRARAVQSPKVALRRRLQGHGRVVTEYGLSARAKQAGLTTKGA